MTDLSFEVIPCVCTTGEKPTCEAQPKELKFPKPQINAFKWSTSIFFKRM